MIASSIQVQKRAKEEEIENSDEETKNNDNTHDKNDDQSKRRNEENKKLLKPTLPPSKIQDLKTHKPNQRITGKIVDISAIKKFKKGPRTSQVLNFEIQGKSPVSHNYRLL